MIKKNIPARFIVPLIAASSVIRKEKIFKELLQLAKEKKLSSGKIYEVLLQTYLFAGFPSALISLKMFNEFFPYTKRKNRTHTQTEFKIKGEKTCRKIYGDKYEKLIENVSSFSPDIADWLVSEGYGKVLSRNQLSLKERELSIISMLTVLKFEDQLYSHINGAFRLGIKEKSILEIFDLMNIFRNKYYSGFGKRILKKFQNRKNL